MPTVRRETETEAQTWSFTFDPGKMRLALWSWKRETRKSKRHVWRIEKQWDAIYSGPRYGNHERPHVPVDVAREARRVFVESLRVEGDEAAMPASEEAK